ncbi:MAG: hypothetical protein KDI63_09575 [Gammaproteobacteria bacterium]|nr:hypothetical protein [Gammaproteobacteria bacterium]
MSSNGFGVWAMLAFWGSALGGIVLGISWARSKQRHNPLSRELLRKSLQQRLERGELSREDYEQRIRALDDKRPNA